MVNSTENQGKNLMSREILIKSIIIMLVLVNMVLNVEHR